MSMQAGRGPKMAHTPPVGYDSKNNQPEIQKMMISGHVIYIILNKRKKWFRNMCSKFSSNACKWSKVLTTQGSDEGGAAT